MVEEKRPFHSTAKVLDNGTITFSTVSLKYVGPPRQEIDDAWKKLLERGYHRNDVLCGLEADEVHSADPCPD